MATSVIMPALEMAQETGKLVKWYKREGDSVTKGELLMAIETDKALIELEAEAGGVLGGVSAQEGDVINVGQVIAWLLAPGEAAPATVTQTRSGRQSTTAAPAERSSAVAEKSTAAGERLLLSPKARRLAAERGVNVSEIRGSGPGGAVVADDLKDAAGAASEEPGQTWRIMSDRVTASWTSVPHFFLTRDVDATGMAAMRESLVKPGSDTAERVTFTDQLVACVARALKQHPRLNASFAQGTIRYHSEINIGIATAIESGLVVPVIHGADRLSVHDIAARRRELVARARAGRLQPADLANGTFTISNLGMFEIDAFSAIVNAPQAAILAVGRIADRVVAEDGRAVVRPRMTMTLSCDHRVVDGARGAEFLRDLAAAVEQPAG